MSGGTWVSLFSGGKDSVGAFYRATEAGLDVTRLVTVHPGSDSYLYHVPATQLSELAAESIGMALTTVETPDLTAQDSTTRGDQEIEPLERTLAELATRLPEGLAGLTVGAIASDFQAGRIREMCRRLDIDMYAPLWRMDPIELGRWFLETGFEIRIIQVAAAGLDQSWLGRTLDADTLDELIALNEEYGVHVLGEGGEFETLVTDGPHMSRPIEITYRKSWDGTRGHLDIETATLG